MNERRRCKRVPFGQWATLRSGNQVQRCLVKDISPLGARIALTSSLRMDQVFEMRFTRDARVARPCRVVWFAETEGGVAFLENAAPIDPRSFLLTAVDLDC